MRSRALSGELRLVAAFVVGLGVSACAKDIAHRGTRPPSAEVAVWDFPQEPDPSTMRLWPVSSEGPSRSRRHLETRKEDGRLVAVVTGTDPYFLWHFENPTPSFAVHLEFNAVQEGDVQVFWETPRCLVFSEPCSKTVHAVLGVQTFEVLLDSADPLRELRLDLPDHVGAELVFDSIAVLRSPMLQKPWTPNEHVAEVTSTSTGLVVDANAADPWLTVETPGFDAARAGAAELTLRGPGTSMPQLYWATSGGFTEAASARFAPADAGALTHRVTLAGREGWSGEIRMLRLDPGDSAGRYVIERLALVRAP